LLFTDVSVQIIGPVFKGREALVLIYTALEAESVSNGPKTPSFKLIA
jgi:hypothetical protein